MTDRVPYYNTEEGCNIGDEDDADGTCLPIKAHFLVLTFPDDYGPRFEIRCPENGCVRLHRGTEDGSMASWSMDGECWLREWYSGMGDQELIGGGDGLKVSFALEGESDCDMVMLYPTRVVSVSKDPVMP